MADLDSIAGLYVGQLNEDELVEFERAVKAGLAYRSYAGPAGLMGVAKVQVIRPLPEPTP